MKVNMTDKPNYCCVVSSEKKKPPRLGSTLPRAHWGIIFICVQTRFLSDSWETFAAPYEISLMLEGQKNLGGDGCHTGHATQQEHNVSVESFH